MKLSIMSRRTLWFILEQQMWTVHDVIRFAADTKLIPDVDATVLLKKVTELENYLKTARILDLKEGHTDAIPHPAQSEELLTEDHTPQDDVGSL